MKQKLNQSGFGGLEIMLILAVILLIGGIGAFVYTKHFRQGVTTLKVSTGPNSDSSGNSTSPNGVPASAGQKTGTPGTATNTVIKIPEQNFQISVPASLSDLTYHISTTGPGTAVVTFSTKTLATAIPACAADQKNGAFDIVTRGTGSYPSQANPSNGGLIKQYSSSYLAYTLPNAPCAKGLSVANQNLLDDQAQAFYGALNTAQAIPN